MKRPNSGSPFAILVLSSLALFSTPVWAGNDSGSNDLTDADRTAMAEGAQKYNECLRKESQAIMGNYRDVRKIADVAMKKCAPVLDDLKAELTARKLDPGLTSGFVHYASNMGARRLLKQLIAQRATESSASP